MKRQVTAARTATTTLVLVVLAGATFAVAAKQFSPLLNTAHAAAQDATVPAAPAPDATEAAVTANPTIEGKWVILHTVQGGYIGDKLRVSTLGRSDYVVFPMARNGVVNDVWMPMSKVTMLQSFDSKEAADRYNQPVEDPFGGPAAGG